MFVSVIVCDVDYYGFHFSFLGHMYKDLTFITRFECITDLYKMVCPENETSVNITIPTVMIPNSAGKKLSDYLTSGKSGKFFNFFTSGDYWNILCQ